MGEQLWRLAVACKEKEEQQEVQGLSGGMG